jgi:2-methylcitrate dehydratase PrpD
MSAPFCLAVAIRNGGIRVTDLRNFEDVALSALVGRIHVARDANLPGHASRVTVRTSGESTFTAEGTLNADMFRWGRDRAIKQLRALADEMPLSPQRLESFMAVSLDLENRGVRDLISSTLRPKRRTRLN